MPVYFDRFHSPLRRAEWAGLMWRAAARSRPTASSAALTMLEVGAFTTITPVWVAAFTSTLSRPTPARATTWRFLAAARASASTLVAERTRIALTSAMAGSSSARSAPLQCRISKSGPSASTVAGLSSSAMSTTGLLTTAVSSWSEVTRDRIPKGPARRCARPTLPEPEQRPEVVRIERGGGAPALATRPPLDPHRDADVVVPATLGGYDVSLRQPTGVH